MAWWATTGFLPSSASTLSRDTDADDMQKEVGYGKEVY